MLISGIFSLYSLEWNNSRWYSLIEGNKMKALLVVELMPGGICYTTHAYLKNEEEIPFEKEQVKEKWYFDGGKRLFLTDTWGEFASFLWDEKEETLITRIGNETIILTKLSDPLWEELKSQFALEFGQ
jgi:hypothetical protein